MQLLLQVLHPFSQLGDLTPNDNRCNHVFYGRLYRALAVITERLAIADKTRVRAHLDQRRGKARPGTAGPTGGITTMRERDLKRYGFNLCNLHLISPVHQTTLAYDYSQQTYTSRCFVILVQAITNRSHVDTATLGLRLT